MNRLVLALRAFWRSLTDPQFATRVEALFHKVDEGPDLRLLTLLQRDGRLVDFLLEDVDTLDDATIGAAARNIHSGCRKVLREYMTIEPVSQTPEGNSITVEPDFDRTAIRLTGNVPSTGPFRGVVAHHGWRVKEVRFPTLPDVRSNSSVLAPAEVEIT